MNNVLQCPRCEVRLPSPSELNDHLASDHPDFRSTAAHSRLVPNRQEKASPPAAGAR